MQAAVRRADAQPFNDRLPAGLGSHPGKAYDDATELSGGQWQRTALSRTMLLLAEPTAALDPLTEHAQCDRYADSAREVGATRTMVSRRRDTTTLT